MANIKTVYQFDKDGCYKGPEIAFESPLEPGVYHIPANCTELAPPEVAEGNIAQWDGSQWQEVPAPVADDPTEIPPDSPVNPYVKYDELDAAYAEGVQSV